MQESIVHKSTRRRIAQRVGGAGIALATLLTLTACHEARGGGYLGAPVDSGVIGVYSGTANFGFNFTCDADQVKGDITYHDDPSKITLVGNTLPTQFPEIRLHGIVQNVLVQTGPDDPTTDVFDPPFEPADTCQEVIESQAAHFEGSYQSQDKRRPGKGRFNVLVFDQGEPSFEAGTFDGDGFSIDLKLGPYANYTRAGNIKGGNIQVDN
jgi:hypothetical protein